MSWHLCEPIDFETHNQESKSVWEAYNRGRPYRVPVLIGGSIRNLLENPSINRTGFTFDDFFTDPEAQIQAQLAYQKWVRYNVICDREMGPPKNGWELSVDFQNSWEQGWFGCPVKLQAGKVPDTTEILKDNKHALYNIDPPDPLRGNLAARGMEFFEYMHDRCSDMEFEGLPVNPPATIPGEGTDGVFTMAVKLRGTVEACIDMYEDPTYFHDLLDFVTNNIIRRIKAVKEWRWLHNESAVDRGRYKTANWGFADDSIAMLSEKDYAEHIYPYHKRLRDELSDGSPISMHLCGDATHLFPFLNARLNVKSFDTGFPVDFGKLRDTLGPDVQIYGGPSVMVLRSGPPAAIKAEVERICSSGIMAGGRFVLREGNNMAPGTPVEHVMAMYNAGKQNGRYK